MPALPLHDSDRRETPASKTQTRRKRKLPLAVEYAEKRLRPVLGLGTAPLEIEAVSGGRNSLVYFLIAGNRRRAVIYLIKNGKEWRDTRNSLKLGEARGLPLPRLLHARRRGLPGLGPKYWCLTTDYAEGQKLNEILWDEHRVELLASTLARLHAVESDVWGKPRRPKRKPMMTSLRASVERRLVKIRQHPASPEDGFLAEVAEFFDRELSGLPEPARFQLCHHHLFGDDLILGRDEDAITVLDCSSLQYSLASRDLAAIREGFFPNQEAFWRHFLDAYFQHFSPETRSAREGQLPLFRAFHLLIKLQHHLGRRAESTFRHRLQAACGLGVASRSSGSTDWN